MKVIKVSTAHNFQGVLLNPSSKLELISEFNANWRLSHDLTCLKRIKTMVPIVMVVVNDMRMAMVLLILMMSNGEDVADEDDTSDSNSRILFI